MLIFIKRATASEASKISMEPKFVFCSVSLQPVVVTSDTNGIRRRGMEENKVFFQGQFVIAMPGLSDENFSHSVVCISEHKKDGAIGFIINKPHPYIFCRDVFEELGIEYTEKSGGVPVYIGGPVQADRIFILHSGSFDWDGCFKFPPGLAISNTIDIIKAIANGQGPEKYIFLLGCAGWAENQLELEVIHNFWLTTPVDMDILFDFEPEHKWREVIERMGINPALLSTESGTA